MATNKKEKTTTPPSSPAPGSRFLREILGQERAISLRYNGMMVNI